MALAGYGNSVEGLHAVAAAVQAGRVGRLLVDRSRRTRPDVLALIDLVGADDVSFVDDLRNGAHTDAPQGVAAECVPIAPVSLESLAGPDAALLVLDHIEDPHNVGAIARSALAAGVTGLVVSSRRAAPLSAVAFKAAAGALETMPVAVVSSIPEALSRLKDLDVWLVGLDAGAVESMFGLQLFTESVAVVLGSEGDGLSQLASKRCDVLKSIPMVGDTESLNVSVSGALAAFEIMLVRAFTPG